MMPRSGVLSLTPGQAHIWCWQTTIQITAAQLKILPKKERQRLEQGDNLPATRQRVLTRVYLRQLLSAYGDRAPQSWQFRNTQFGKPHLVGRYPWHFNVTHTSGMSAIIIAHSRAVGIDVEDVTRRLPRADDFVLSKTEQQQVLAVSPAHQRRRFFWYWTIKEALGKGLGSGLGAPLNKITIERQARKIVVRERQPQLFSDWHIGSLADGHHRMSWACAPHERGGMSADLQWNKGKLKIYRVA